MISSKFNVQRLMFAASRNFKCFTLMALLAAIVIIGISLGVATRYLQKIPGQAVYSPEV